MFIKYLFIGGCTTLINFIVDFGLRAINIDHQISIIIAWMVSVTFAYFGNKNVVFKSEETNKLKLYIKFLISRIGTLLIEEAMTFIMLDYLKINSLITKTVCQVVIIVLNYILGKIVFTNKRETD